MYEDEDAWVVPPWLRAGSQVGIHMMEGEFVVDEHYNHYDHQDPIAINYDDESASSSHGEYDEYIRSIEERDDSTLARIWPREEWSGPLRPHQHPHTNDEHNVVRDEMAI